jgi:hypothetical protein
MFDIISHKLLFLDGLSITRCLKGNVNSKHPTTQNIQQISNQTSKN